MVEFRVNLSTRAMRRYMQDVATVYPRELSRSIRRVGGVIRRQMTAAVKGPGSSRVGRLAPLSDLHSRLHENKSGGKLRESRAIRITRRGQFGAVIDYVPGLQAYAARWQDGGAASVSKKDVRRGIYMQLADKGVRGFKITPTTQQPARQYTGIIADKMAPDFQRQVLGNLNKIINARANKK